MAANSTRYISKMNDSMASSPCGEATKKKRRSALSSGRRSLVESCIPTIGELHMQVDQQLAAEERIEQITKLAFHHALSTLNDEMKDEPDFLPFRVAAEEEAETMTIRMRKGGMFVEACKKENLQPNPLNVNMDLTISQLEGHIRRFNEESQKWDAIVADLEKKEAALQEKLGEKELSANDLPPAVKDLAKSYLPSPASYSSLLKDAQKLVATATLCMHSFIQDENLVEQSCKVAQIHIQELHRDLEAETFAGSHAPDSTTEVISRLAAQ